MAKINGRNLRLFIDNNAIAEATNCSVSINGNTEDTSTKDTNGIFQTESVVSKSWNANSDGFCEGLIFFLVSTMMNENSLQLSFDQTEKTGMNRSHASAGFARKGTAIINDISLQFNDRATSTITTQFQGKGALTTL